MSGRIAVGIDGSPQSANALDWAIERAVLGGQELRLVSAYSVVADADFYGYTPTGMPVDWFAAHSHELLDAAERHVHEVAPQLTCTQLVRVGPAAHVLADAARDADILVVGRRGLGAARSALLGSVSNQLATHAPCPLIVVGGEQVPTSGPIVMGVDGSEFSVAALKYAVREAAVREASVRAVTAHEPPREVAAADPEFVARMHATRDAEAADIVTKAIDELTPDERHASVSIETVVEVGRPAAAILGCAGDAQLIVVGSHGKGLLRRVLLGSVSREVLYAANRPVAVVGTAAAHPDDPD